MIGVARLLWKPALILLAFAAVALLVQASGFDARAAMASAGSKGPLVFVAVGSVACALAVPRQVVALAGGYAFGFWTGAALALLAEVAGCAADFLWVRILARQAALSFLRRREGGRLDRLDRFLTGQAFTATLTIRLLPVGSNVLLNIAAGVSGVAAAPFLLASAIGYVPQTVVFALAGAGAGLSSGVQFGLAAGLLVASVILGVLLLRRRPVPAPL
ncbi:MAG: VTT domain-containing protein, partial [Acetobacteraceae bacterium]|nr:VTT domain-containing protein [Acetobacteraceae bacterium]